MIYLSPDYRVRPYDSLQWVMERRDNALRGQLNVAGTRWRIIAYCRTKAGLETTLSRLRCDGVHLDPASIAHLPDFFPETSRNTDEMAQSGDGVPS